MLVWQARLLAHHSEWWLPYRLLPFQASQAQWCFAGAQMAACRKHELTLTAESRYNHCPKKAPSQWKPLHCSSGWPTMTAVIRRQFLVLLALSTPLPAVPARWRSSRRPCWSNVLARLDDARTRRQVNHAGLLTWR
jgi:hypothetical protein